MKKFPFGIPTFEKIIATDSLYVDKTKQIYKMITEGTYYFLSRPRRFGKSLTLSTIGSIFEGKKDLFKDTFIFNADYEWETFPVLRFDFSTFSEAEEPEMLKEIIKSDLNFYAKKYSIDLSNELTYSKMFEKLLEELPKQAVLLIDEYDKPILNNINNSEKANICKEILKGFYTVIKASDKNIKFAMLTGVTKFAKISVFSGLNNLSDITMDSEYASLCGYTQEEVDFYFGDEIKKIAKAQDIDVAELNAKIKKWYNGFRFSDANITVYNPVSLMSYVKGRTFKHFWFETATPTFLIDLMKKENFNIAESENYLANMQDFSTFDIENLRVLPILLQAGYLTIVDYEDETYTLNYPNYEVKSAFLNHLLPAYGGANGGSNNLLIRIKIALLENDIEEVFELLETLISTIPYGIHLNYEKYWQSMFYLIFTILGFSIKAEMPMLLLN